MVNYYVNKSVVLLRRRNSLVVNYYVNTRWYNGARVQKAFRMHARKVRQKRGGGHGWYGRFKSDPACQFPSNMSAGIKVPPKSVISPKETTRTYKRTAFACRSVARVMLGMLRKPSIMALSPSRCSAGVQHFSIHTNAFISLSRRRSPMI